MKSAERLLDRIAVKLFRAGSPEHRTPHPLFLDLYQRLHAALDDAELCLHSDVTSRPNRVEVFFDFETWARFVAPREAQVYRALEAEIEQHRARSGYRDDERIVLELFVADPAQRDVPPNRPEVVAHCVPDPTARNDRWRNALKHTTIIGGRPRRDETSRGTRSAHLSPVPSSVPELEMPALPAAPITKPTPIALLAFCDGASKREVALFQPGIFGRSVECDARVLTRAEEGIRDPAEIVSRRALSFAIDELTGVLEVENIGRWPLEVRRTRRPDSPLTEPPPPPETLAIGAKLEIEREVELVWPGDLAEGFRLTARAPRRGTLILASETAEQRVVLRAPRTLVRADRELFGDVDVSFNVDFVDGTGFLVFNNEGSVPLKLGTLEGKQLQWPIDAPRELQAGPISIAVALEESP